MPALKVYGAACYSYVVIGNFIVLKITPVGINFLGWRFYIIWTVFNLSFVSLVYFSYPETADRTLEHIDRYFMEHQSILVVFKDKVRTKHKALGRDHKGS